MFKRRLFQGELVLPPPGLLPLLLVLRDPDHLGITLHSTTTPQKSLTEAGLRGPEYATISINSFRRIMSIDL